MAVSDKLLSMLAHPYLPEALERLAKLHDMFGKPFAVCTDAEIARAFAVEVRVYQKKGGG